MICAECKRDRCAECDDTTKGTDYRGCFCQHGLRGMLINHELVNAAKKKREQT